MKRDNKWSRKSVKGKTVKNGEKDGERETG